MQELGIPGAAVGIVRGDPIEYVQGYGIAGDDGRPVTPQTPFYLASLSKSFTATAVMQLVGAGKLELDAPVQRYDYRLCGAISDCVTIERRRGGLNEVTRPFSLPTISGAFLPSRDIAVV